MMSSHDEKNRQKTQANVSRRAFRKKSSPVIYISRKHFEIPPQSDFFPLQVAFTVSHLFFVFALRFVFGQFLITHFDSYMIKLEKTLEFCIAPQERGLVGNSDINRNAIASEERPMNWVFFLPALIVLRLSLFWISFVSVLFGRKEITINQMRMKVVGFRQWYLSIRHYAVQSYTRDELAIKEARCSLLFWRIIYNIDSRIFMRTPSDDVYVNILNESLQSDQAHKCARHRNSGRVKKSSLNEVDGDSTDEEALTTEEMLDKYSKLKDSPSIDPDYEREEEPSSEDISSGVDTEEEKTESQKHLNGEESANCSINGSNSYGSDKDIRARSKPKSSVSIDENQMKEMEDQLVLKIMSHFKTNFNYTPLSVAVDDIFYSPIGSPPDRGYTSASDFHLNTSEDLLMNDTLKSKDLSQESLSTPTKT